jgi:stearoyl-CoA desaturase (delta-9 desaturase)
MNVKASIPFWLIHVLAVVGTIAFGVTPRALIVFLVMVWGREWFITAGYHRYFAHRSYKTSRAFQLFLAVGGATCAQKGPLWWAGNHREHHRYSDTELDIHSPLRGFWWSHVGWIVCDKYDAVPTERIKDFARFPELRFVDKWNGLFPWIAAVAAFLFAGLPGLFFGFMLGTVMLWHNTFLVNSLAHVMGRRRYVTDDTSRNSLLIAITTLGEGWHNNHHHLQSSARNGFYWWEIDVTYYVLKVLSWVGLVRDLKVPSAEVRDADKVADGNFDIGMFKAHWARAQATVAHSHAAAAPATPIAAAGLHLPEDAQGLDPAVVESELAAVQRDTVEIDVEESKADLDALIQGAVGPAEELARITRKGNRELRRLES